MILEWNCHSQPLIRSFDYGLETPFSPTDEIILFDPLFIIKTELQSTQFLWAHEWLSLPYGVFSLLNPGTLQFDSLFGKNHNVNILNRWIITIWPMSSVSWVRLAERILIQSVIAVWDLELQIIIDWYRNHFRTIHSFSYSCWILTLYLLISAARLMRHSSDFFVFS
jgi:hypothetical protein